MIVIAAIIEVFFNALDAAADGQTGRFARWLLATGLLFALAFVVERHKLLQEE